ncbi:hypothetical protein BGZ70_009275 [Mortierella alpina]|uniref:Uncharacterized protein n=1 Tax=Mortierella alpina TaxID=64518 RepID=A0A9P6JDQ1_MORAP|nr:hypothetical protein BGZ70_009275 [Mortierella alpina]
MARVSIQGKVTSKKISTWLKSTFELNSILAVNQQGDHLLHSEDHQDTLDHDHLHHDADGYLSDSSSLSNEELTDHDRTPLRRAISLEDLSSAAAIHRQLHTSGLLQASRLRPRHRSHQGQHAATAPSHRYIASFAEPITRPASSASIYHRHQRSTEGGSDMDMSYVPLKDRPHSAMSLRNDHSNRLSSYMLQEQHAANSSLPTPDASPEELSDSSDELVIIQGELLEEARATRSAERLRAQIRQNTLPGAVANTHPETEAETEARTSGDISLHGELEGGSWNWLTDAPFIDALVNWIEGPDHPPQQKTQDKDKPNPWLDIPFQFIALLTYPEPDPKSGSKPSLAAYTLMVRYCSFDFFVVVLFASNCAMLFLMKNSGRMNVNMAKRAVRQRVGWAKQWAGGIFKRGGNSNSGNPAVAIASSHQNQHSGHSSTASAGHLRQLYVSSQAATTAEPIRNSQPSPAPGDSGAQASAETSPQMKRRGLFGKRVAVSTTGSHSAPSLGDPSVTTSAASTPAIPLHSSNGAAHGDGASIMTGTTQKKRFFRRNNNSNQSASSTTTLATPTAAPASAPIPIPSRTSISSSSSAVRTHQHHASTSSVGTPSLAARSTAMQTQLSSSPLAKSHPPPSSSSSSSSAQSPSQPLLSSFLSSSPAGGAIGEREGRLSPSARVLSAPASSSSSSSPALFKPRDGSVQTTTAESSTLSLSTKNISLRSDTDDAALVSPTPIPVPFSTPHLTSSPIIASGLSQLLQNRPSLDHIPNSNQMTENNNNNNGAVQQEKSDKDTPAPYSSVPEATRDHVKKKEGHGPQLGVLGQEKDTQHESMLDAVTSAAADAMEGV